jgi:hypothetical protein
MADPIPRAQIYGWVASGVAVILAVLLVWSWNSGRLAKEDLSKELERVKLEKSELLAERDASKKELSQREKELLMGNADLEIEVARLKDVLGRKPKVIEIVKWETAPGAVLPATDGRVCPPAADGKMPKVLLVEGDTMHAEVAELTYETKEDNHVIIGKASCFRDTPTSLLLFSGVIKAPLSTAIVRPDAVPPRWGAGLYMGFSKDGWALGPEVAFPPLHVFSVQTEVNAGVGLGSGGNFQGGASAVVRW